MLIRWLYAIVSKTTAAGMHLSFGKTVQEQGGEVSGLSVVMVLRPIVYFGEEARTPDRIRLVQR